jgi:RimJ/RimL family protein N-acetyltransferase
MDTTPLQAAERPLGAVVEDWQPRLRPDDRLLFGASVVVEPLDVARHAASLWQAFSADSEGRLWDYMGYGPFANRTAMAATYEKLASGKDPKFYAIVPKPGRRAEGVASFLRITPEHGTIEIGHICLSPSLQKSRAATEALFLMMRFALDDLGYRRLEWKCDALNAPSRRAAERLGFTFEGIFRHHMVVKGRNRDTAWYAIVSDDWPPLRRAFNRWLAADNFDPEGRQKQPLSAFR